MTLIVFEYCKYHYLIFNITILRYSNVKLDKTVTH